MIVNVIHRPGPGKQFELFKLQQDFAHELELKVTILLQYEQLFDDEIIQLVKKHHSRFKDEIGIWYSDIPSQYMSAIVDKKEPFLWLYSAEDKQKILKASLEKFKEVFDSNPLSVGSYHMDRVCLKLLKQLSPATKITIGGCFEEGVKVFHGCNNSWYLFNEGMPFSPWYPSLNNSLVPAQNQEDWEGIIAVPHLARDLVLSYEGRNDFFASHPANVQRAMANEGIKAPYVLNLLDMYRFQEEYNDGFSYTNVFVGPGWLSGNPNVQDPDDVTQQLYYNYLKYFTELRSQGLLTDMHMAEFADWFLENVPIGKPQHYFAKELLYGSGKHYYWYIDPVMRVTLDMEQGGSIGDFRPFCGQQIRNTGSDSEHLAMASNPYLIHSQYRSGNSYHSADGSRTTLLLEYAGNVVDLCNYPTKITSITTDEATTTIEATPVYICFPAGLAITLKSTYIINRQGEINIRRKIIETSDPTKVITAREYLKGCYGTTEYPENLKGITLSIDDDPEKTFPYSYSSRSLEKSMADCVSAHIPQLNTKLSLLKRDDNAYKARASDGYLFSPFYTLELCGELSIDKEMHTCLKVTKI